MYYPKVDKIQLRKEKKNYFLCDFVRMIQYPKGGGFLIRHNDYDEQYGKDVVAALLPLTIKKIKKTQVSLLLMKKVVYILFIKIKK